MDVLAPSPRDAEYEIEQFSNGVGIKWAPKKLETASSHRAEDLEDAEVEENITEIRSGGAVKAYELLSRLASSTFGSISGSKSGSTAAHAVKRGVKPWMQTEKSERNRTPEPSTGFNRPTKLATFVLRWSSSRLTVVLPLLRRSDR